MQKGRGPGEGIFALLYLGLRHFCFPTIKKRELLLLSKYMMKFLTTMRILHRLIVQILWIFFKKSSNFVQKAQPTFTFCKIISFCLGALRLPMVFFRYNPGIFEIAHQPTVGKREVPAQKRRENKVFKNQSFFFRL
jgi:hypothetical protein